MTIQIGNAEVEALIVDRMASGSFESVEEALRFVLQAAPPSPISEIPQRSWAEIFEAAQGLGGDDLDFSRDQSPGREVSFS